MRIKILWEDEDIIVVEKPAGVATQTGKGFEVDVISYLRSYEKRKSKGKSNYIGVVHRLDQPVHGILVFGKTKEATSKLSRDVAKHNISKWYYALLSSPPKENSGTLVHFLSQDQMAQKAILSSINDPNGKRCELTYEVIDSPEVVSLLFPDCTGTLVRIQLLTGRFHQIRAQFSAMGCPLVGDVKYGAPALPDRHTLCLCAYHLEFTHPRTGQPMNFTLL